MKLIPGKRSYFTRRFDKPINLGSWFLVRLKGYQMEIFHPLIALSCCVAIGVFRGSPQGLFSSGSC